MSPPPSHSPPPASTPQLDESQLPKGQCRYILMIPELKGQRCGCMGFDHNKSLPGATCHCGHLSCFHVPSADAPSPIKNKAEIELIKQRVREIEESLDRNDHDRLSGLISRISELEETVEKNKEEASAELKGSYRNASAAWQLVSQLEQTVKKLQETVQSHDEQMTKTGIQVDELVNRQLELLDSDEMMEERIEKLESAEPLLSPPQDIDSADTPFEPLHLSPTTTNTHQQTINPPQPNQTFRSPAIGPLRPWTIHVSLMPSREQPFPFEKDTTSYKRCLSRGLHRMIAVEGDDAHAFTTAVSRAFQSLLKGRPWMPLQAKLCDAERLQGLPMLRQLEPSFIHGQYDRAFLRQHCAVLDVSGKMDSLYIAMEHDTLSWNFLKRSPIYLEGLESAWEHDVVLDQKDDQDPSSRDHYGDEGGDESPPAGNIVGAFKGLKRSMSEVSCSSSLDDTEGPLTKLPRTCKSSRLEMRRGVETAR
ncbi:hypothetical protein NCS57_01246800 [Fusarium keratoplasticum]|uniref:Uncharacterized protein n=1 Tax=Fusarium keratoplasticum TaxID=1328300 RepID=A0ACC0QJ57_9HYPO|nr:hypothetical protein NCS57_01246800 [Fusarium keratoplasticum]KAI8654993.1 hypothetical protein NCS57_01246800 [Fusarium keratoplasticum]KAI8655838.1 hypothetical protein NCS55_01237000 [Fusarium keratoplasticum]